MLGQGVRVVVLDYSAIRIVPATYDIGTRIYVQGLVQFAVEEEEF